MSNNKVYFPNLDGLRFFSFLAVFFCHSFISEKIANSNNSVYNAIRYLFSNGSLGVNFFFVLSGFLITYLLLAEKNYTNRIDVKKFYLRRILRIWPLFYFNVLFGFIAFPFIKSLFGEASLETADYRYYISFFTNFDLIKNGEPDSSMLSILWSVSIEEQFYLIWPILLIIIPLKYYNHFFISSIFITSFFAIVFKLSGFNTITCSSNLLIGALFANLAYNKSAFLNYIINLKKIEIYFLYLLTAIMVFCYVAIGNLGYINMVVYKVILAILFGIIIMEQNYAKNSFYKMHRLKWVSDTGTYTYGLYCLHMIGILAAVKICNKFGLNSNIYKLFLIEMPLAFLFAYIIARLSFKFYETPFLNFKNKFSIIKKH